MDKLNQSKFSPEDENYYQRQRQKIIKEKNLSKAKDRLTKLKKKLERRAQRKKFFQEVKFKLKNFNDRFFNLNTLVGILLALNLLRELRSNELKSKLEEQQCYIQHLENTMIERQLQTIGKDLLKNHFPKILIGSGMILIPGIKHVVQHSQTNQNLKQTTVKN